MKEVVIQFPRPALFVARQGLPFCDQHHNYYNDENTYKNIYTWSEPGHRFHHSTKEFILINSFCGTGFTKGQNIGDK